MNQVLLNQWLCDDCDEEMFARSEMIPEFCPYCRSASTLTDALVVKAQPWKGEELQ